MLYIYVAKIPWVRDWYAREKNFFSIGQRKNPEYEVAYVPAAYE